MAIEILCNYPLRFVTADHWRESEAQSQCIEKKEAKTRRLRPCRPGEMVSDTASFPRPTNGNTIQLPYIQLYASDRRCSYHARGLQALPMRGAEDGIPNLLDSLPLGQRSDTGVLLAEPRGAVFAMVVGTTGENRQWWTRRMRGDLLTGF